MQHVVHESRCSQFSRAWPPLALTWMPRPRVLKLKPSLFTITKLFHFFMHVFVIQCIITCSCFSGSCFHAYGSPTWNPLQIICIYMCALYISWSYQLISHHLPSYICKHTFTHSQLWLLFIFYIWYNMSHAYLFYWLNSD